MTETLGVELPPGSPVSSFIHEHVEPRLGEFNTFEKVKTHGGLLREAGRGKKLRSRAVGNSQAFLTQHTTVGGMGEIVTSLVSDLAFEMSQSRSTTLSLVRDASLPVPRAQSFRHQDRIQAQRFARSLTGPVTLQRDYSRLLNAPLTPLETGASFSEAWSSAATREDAVLFLAETPPGLTLRVFVVQEEAVSAIVCIPFYVVGDGRSTLRELFEERVSLRQRHAFLAERVPYKNGLMHDSPGPDPSQEILPSGDVRLFGRSVNPFHEGIPVDVTDLLSEDLKELAVNAAWALPGLGAGAVDLLAPTLSGPEDAVVMGIDVNARLELHHYPALGKPRPVAETIMKNLIQRVR